MACVNNDEMKMATRRSIKRKNLEKEVDSILSQDESDEDCNTGGKMDEVIPKTPSKNKTLYPATPKASQAVLQEIYQTPRRSCRKSIKPTQEYEDIVRKSCTRSTKKHLSPTEERKDENQENEIVPPKWTPAKVGRVSQKRGRKSRRTLNVKKQKETGILEQQTSSEKEFDETEENIHAQKVVEELVDDMGEESGDRVEKTEDYTVQLNVETESIGKDLNEITDEIKKPVMEFTKKFQVEEIVNNMEQLNVKTECNNSEEIEKNLKQPQREKYEILKDNNETFLLIQEDSEDCDEFAEKSLQEKICIVYENNISNEEINKDSNNELSSPTTNKNLPAENAAFGSYLRSKDINLSDLGLNPLKEDEEEEKAKIDDDKTKLNLKETEEMPSLIICDDDEEDVLPCENLNDTFDASDCVEILEVEKVKKESEEFMETLQISDEDGETPRKRPRIILTDTELNDHFISTPIRSTTKAKIAITTPKQDLLSTPKIEHRSSKTRLPTPYINKQNFKFNSQGKENIARKTPNKTISNTSLTSMEPKEIVLRGIRKRSLSVCIDGRETKFQKFLAGPSAKVKQDRMVSFYSPANQTAIIGELDIQIAKSLKKQKPKEKDSLKKYVTTRRKRSTSFDESIMSSLLPRPVVNTSNKTQTASSLPKPLPRTKLPNFAAIHQKQFQKMENLVDHVNRKQERSKNLINSDTKLKPVSAKKIAFNTTNLNNLSTEKPKVLKRVEMKKTLFNATVTAENQAEGNVPITKKVIDFPVPKLGEIKATNSSVFSNKHTNKYLKPSQTMNVEKTRLNSKTVVAQSKPRFNLSTSVMVQPTTSAFADNANTSHMGNKQTSSTRLQRHMELFKGRAPSTKAGVASRRNEVILKGVRSNRRFELQMQHRKNLEQ